MSNTEIIRLLGEMVTLLRIDEGNPQAFRVRAYEKALGAVTDLTTNVVDMSEQDLVGIPAIGKGIARTIRDLVETGTTRRLEKLRLSYPPPLVDLTRIPGLGPKTVLALRDELGVESVTDLRRALAEGKVRHVRGLGVKSEQKMARSIDRLGLHGKDRRTPIGIAVAIADELVADMARVPGVTAVEPCGSLRRFNETVGDVDIVVAARDATAVIDAFFHHPLAAEVVAGGESKAAILIRGGLQVDLRVVAPHQFGAAVVYFTGSKGHNIQLRQRAADRGLLLNEYALADVNGGVVLENGDEDDIYRALGLAWIPPPLREGRDEVELASRGDLPDVVGAHDLRGDLHFHTDWSGDGRASMETMLAAASDAGWEYVAVTDHGENLAINGLSRHRMLAQRDRLRTFGKIHTGMALLHGCELNVGPDGSVDYDQGFLSGFDWCVASIHSHFDLPADVQTARLAAAMRHPSVRAVGHLSGRKLGRRPGIEFDVDMILDTAEDTRCVIEINGSIDRLDATREVMRRARHRDVLFTIATDAHHPSDLVRHRYGVLYAQGGWVEAERVVNTWPQERFLDWLRYGSA